MAKKRKIPVSLCVIYALTTHNPEYHHGFRFRLHDLDDDMWYFRDKERMFDLMSIHALYPVTPAEMEKARLARSDQREHGGLPASRAETAPKKSTRKLSKSIHRAPEVAVDVTPVVMAIEEFIDAKLRENPTKADTSSRLVKCRNDLGAILGQAFRGSR